MEPIAEDAIPWIGRGRLVKRFQEFDNDMRVSHCDHWVSVEWDIRSENLPKVPVPSTVAGAA